MEQLPLGSAAPLLDLQHLQLRVAGQSVVRDVNLQIAAGEVVALIGESGSGKTLTASAIMQLLPLAVTVDSHSVIQFQNQDLMDYSEATLRKLRGSQISMVFQEPMQALNPVMTIGVQIAEVLRVHKKLKKKQLKSEILALLNLVGLPFPERQMNAYPHQLSGGMRQRVVIAIAIAAKPKLLIADEPTSALDVITQAKIIELLLKLQREFNMAMFFITHDLLLAKRVADRIVVIKQGQIIEQAATKNFFTVAQHAYSRELIQAATLSGLLPCDKPVALQPTLLEVRDLCVYFPIQKGILKRTVDWVKAVDAVSFQVKARQTVAIIGESGSGKTTLAKAILRLLPIYSGHVLFRDVDLAQLNAEKLRKLRKDIQMVFQDPFAALNPRMLVRDILAEGIMAQNLVPSKTALQTRIDELLQQVELPLDSKDRYPHEFSGGQRQRIVIARALAVNPKLLICDEPTSALDVTTQLHILQLLRRLQQQLGLGYLLITHNIQLALKFADYIIVMRNGRLLVSGAPEELTRNPQDKYIQELLLV